MPSLIARWNSAVGSYAEEYEYQDLFESYLHQRTILSIAYAVVPHIAKRLTELDRDRRLSVLDDLALVDKVRLTPPSEVDAYVQTLKTTVAEPLRDILVQNARDRHPTLPDDLAPAYLTAIEHAKSLAGDDWGRARYDEPGPHCFRRHVRHLRTSGWTDEDIAFGVAALRKTDDAGLELVYSDMTHALESMKSLTTTPPGWFERTGLRDTGELRSLGFLALHSLAWLAEANDMASMLQAT